MESERTKMTVNLGGIKVITVNVSPSEGKIAELAANMITNKVNFYKGRFDKADDCDIMSMVALDIAERFVTLESQKNTSILASRTEEIIDRIDEALKEE